jgi:hypothetical protein
LTEEAFSPQVPAECRKHSGIPQEAFVMLSLARFSPRNKMDLAPFLECIEWLSQSEALPPSVLVLAGSGKTQDVALVQDMVSRLNLQNMVQIRANLSEREKRRLLGAADVFITLADNFQETFGITILEAMAQGLPVIASDFNGYRELVQHGQTGFLIPTYFSASCQPWEALQGLLDPSILRLYQAQKVAFDMAELSRAITILAANEHLRREMGIRALSRMLPYRWSQVIAGYESLWDRQRQEADGFPVAQNASNGRGSLLLPSTRTSFSHYPTMCLNPATGIRLSDYGKARWNQGFQPIVYAEITPFLDEFCQNALLQSLSKRDSIVGDLIMETQARSGISEAMVTLNIDWLMKHGYITVLPESDSSGEGDTES